MILKYKPIEIIENEINNVDTLTVVISIINNNSFNPNKTYAIIFKKDSHFAKNLIEYPTEIFSLDLEDFKIRKIQFDYLDKKYGYFHNSLINQLVSNKSATEIELDLIKDSLNECLFSCHAEMYLYFIYKVIFNREFKSISYDENFKKNIFNRFREVIAVILKDNYEITIDPLKKLSVTEIQEIRSKYADALDYGQGFTDSIANFVMKNDKALNVSSNLLKDRKYFYNFYIQKTLIEAFIVCLKRIISNQNSNEYFGHEMVVSDERVELKIFPTPFGFTQVEKITEFSKEDKLENYLLNYLAKNDFIKIENEETKNALKTKWIFEKKDIINLFYVDRKYTLNKANFGRQDRSYMFDSLMAKGQINLSISQLLNTVYNNV
ncbi:hypothetical protein BXY82_0905 [Gelidibacter sediminis]|uniref:Uncharacterized protein n=1 Tax=Gelidibacter sediminis TaxID=1608710 RepID=A0A4R7Q774_9FLAO|nr:hypothetical protein [Gelidibacter sediminis]TDU43493.1 hypothetical protein BXY82_0905 [Gelidibacter sediminis]